MADTDDGRVSAIERMLRSAQSAAASARADDAAVPDAAADEELARVMEELAKNPNAAAMLQTLFEQELADADPSSEEAKALRVRLDEAKNHFAQQQKQNDMMLITPRPGLVIKSHLTKKMEDYPEGMKVFINLCHSPDIPPPPTMDYEEVARAMIEQDNVSFKVPLSLSAPKIDKDKAGKPCLVFDAACNTTPYRRATKDASFHAFMVTLCCEWIESKHNLSLSRDVSFPKLKSKGPISTHSIRRQSKSIISEIPKTTPAVSKAISEKPSLASAKEATPSEVASKDAVVPFHEVFSEPPGPNPEFIVVRVSLPQLATVKQNIVLDVEPSAIFLCPLEGSAAQKVYKDLEITLQTRVSLDEVGAQFDLSSRVLTVTLVCEKD
ncbi:PIH1 domain-containing protein 1 [Entophlyctis luteolus]|nr:PIH1 domain-containing protein 1 [Entophlyctis luteolus]